MNENNSQISGINNYQQGNANGGINNYQQGNANVGTNSYQQGNANGGTNSYQQGNANVGMNSYQQGNANGGMNSYQQGSTNIGMNSYQQRNTNVGTNSYQQGSASNGMNQYQKNTAGQNVNSYGSAGSGVQNGGVYGNVSRPYVTGNATQGTNQTVAQNSVYASNTSGNNTTSTTANESSTETKDKKHKSATNKKGMGVGGKILLTAVYGLVFGVVAGLAFFAIKEIGGVIAPNTNSSTNIVPSTDVANLITDVIDEVDPTAGNGIANTDVTNNQPAIQTNTSTTLVVTDVTNVVDKVMPSIVSIRNSFTANYFYYTKSEEASGSGIIIGSNDEELLIVTNYHVIQDADTLTITFCDNSEAVAQVKGKDQSMDLAVIAVDYQDLTKETRDNIRIATMGDSNNLKVGETAIAIGNSLGYGQSVTTGVVSALNREMDMDGVKGTFIQTDAAINPGNSGGALLNIAGEVIGINSNKIGGSAVEGMGYAIPISAAKPILEDLMAKETKKLAADDKQAYLGISGANITAQEQLFYGYPNGIYVANVSEGTAAEKGGLQKGDFIVEFDGENISTMEDLQKLLMYYEEGDTVDLKVYRSTDRGYQEMVITVTLGNRADAEG